MSLLTSLGEEAGGLERGTLTTVGSTDHAVHLCDSGVALGPQAQQQTSWGLATQNTATSGWKTEKGQPGTLLWSPSSEAGFLRLDRFVTDTCSLCLSSTWQQLEGPTV